VFSPACLCVKRLRGVEIYLNKLSTALSEVCYQRFSDGTQTQLLLDSYTLQDGDTGRRVAREVFQSVERVICMLFKGGSCSKVLVWGWSS